MSILVLLFCSCLTEIARPAFDLSLPPALVFTPEPFVIIDHQNNDAGQDIPEWVSLALEGNFRELETGDAFAGRFVFIANSEGSNINALNSWTDRFSAEQDFARLAAARIEARFSSNVPNPDQAYGSYFPALIRAASDAAWGGAVRVDDFWVQKRYTPAGNGEEAFAEDAYPGAFAANGLEPAPEREAWEFFILLTMERTLFASQLETIFQNLRPLPPPSPAQAAAANRVRERFFEGF
ncbi:MAG: hypothetical protein FWH19_02830 [Treponema sp.]|nr:hypothetical protein [Treponema sp.]